MNASNAAVTRDTDGNNRLIWSLLSKRMRIVYSGPAVAVLAIDPCDMFSLWDEKILWCINVDLHAFNDCYKRRSFS
jgi:hypothetical protein